MIHRSVEGAGVSVSIVRPTVGFTGAVDSVIDYPPLYGVFVSTAMNYLTQRPSIAKS